MTANEIINHIAKSDEYLLITKRICKGYGDVSEDLFQDLIVILCEYDPIKLEAVNEKGFLKWFIIKTLTNQLHSHKGKFNRQHIRYNKRHVANDFSRLNIQDIEYDKEADAIYDQIIKDLDTARDKDEYYEKTLFKEFVKVGNKVKLAAETGIDRRSIGYTVKKVREEIKSKFKNR